MIFLTVGTQLSFDRLVVEVDKWAGENKQTQIFGQIGPTSYEPKHFNHVDFLKPDEIDVFFQKADLIISHAGMGSVLSAFKYKKPLIIVPRRADLHEHRNDHQMATASWLKQEFDVTVLYEPFEFGDYMKTAACIPAARQVGEHAQPELVDRLRTFIFCNGH